ncbi:MAG: PAS domain-containing sensor histidine kinase [Pontiellaceae bacterium]|nr:PAS domain-containing sensor histidine kinase [Pontiellaceae bacterium]
MEQPDNPDSLCDLSERTSPEELQHEIRYFVDHPEPFSILDALPDAIVILDQHRQITYANRTLLNIYPELTPEEIYGLRLGELINCIHRNDIPSGCGTSRRCTLCGANRAILAGLQGAQAEEQCRANVENPIHALDLLIYCTPLSFMNKPFTMVLIKDISGEKRRKALEQTFFHDILNTAAGLHGYAELLIDSSCSELEELRFREIFPHLTKQLVDEIEAQRLILQAENKQIVLHLESFSPKKLLNEIAELYFLFQAVDRRNIAVYVDEALDNILSDHTLLARIIGNMTKNALEATQESDTVTLRAEKLPEGTEFSVHNPGAMPEEVQLQVFDRSFSTKGPNRGLGTYSIRLFGEEYLGGKVSFHSDEASGTTFKIFLPDDQSTKD